MSRPSGSLSLASVVALTLFVASTPTTATPAFSVDVFSPSLVVFGFAELGTLFAAVATRLGRGEALLATLLLPAATPLFLSAVRCTGAVLEHEPLGSVWRWLAITSGLNVLYLLVAVVTFEYVLED